VTIREPPVLLLDPSADAPGGSSLAKQLTALGVAIDVSDDVGAAAEALRQGEGGPRQPAVLLVGPGWERPIAVGRALHAAAPSAHVAFVAHHDRIAPLRHELTLAPMVGPLWSLTAIDDPALPGLLAGAARTVAQRRHFRTTLDQLNAQRAAQAQVEGGDHRRLALSERLLAEILTHTVDAIVSLDPAGVVRDWNRGAEVLFGMPESEAIGRPLADAAAWSEDIQKLLSRRASGEAMLRRSLRCETRAGHRYVELTLSPIRDDDGSTIGWAVILRDVTEQKRDADALAAIAIEHQRAEERVRALLQSERAAREQAEKAGRTKDEFLATLSHELRTPLNAILGWAHLLRRSPPGGQVDASKGLEVIERNARAQKRIIEDLLDMSAILNGRLQLDVRPVDLAAALRGAVEAVRPAAEARGVSLDAALDPTGAPVSGDADRLQQVFWNLLSNGVKFTPRGGRVEVVLARAGSHAEVRVVDTGSGIAPDFLPHMFDRFRQADATTTRQHGGLGLGLAIAKRLVELHGGTIRVESPGPGLGTTALVALPLAARVSYPPGR
jgi:PAS domain S-box-containing protein